mgnify:CR=1 FL=1
MKETSIPDIDFAERMRIATAIAGINLTDFGILLMYRIFCAIQDQGGDLTVNEITDIRKQCDKEMQEHNEKYKFSR